MSDTPNGPAPGRPAASIRTSVIEPLGKWIALFGSIIAVGQAGTSWISGYWNSQAEQQRAAQELALMELKERSALASEYLRLIINKDTAPAEKVTLLDALGAIEQHPLQQWAQERHTVYKALLARNEAAFEAQRRAAEAKEGAEREEAMLQAEIIRLNSEIQLDPDNPERRDRLRQEIIEKSGLLAKVRARVSITDLRFTETRSTYIQVQQSFTTVQAPPPAGTSRGVEVVARATSGVAPVPSTLPSAGPPRPASVPSSRPPSPALPAPAADPPAMAPAPQASGPPTPVQSTPAYSSGSEYGRLMTSITEISEKITATQLGRYFPEAARANIEVAAPYLQAALQEFRVTDRRLIAAIVATIAVETPRFETYEEPVSAGARLEGRTALGNTRPGDGERFRGRGYIGLTGRANYTTMSSRLGLGTRLVDSPEDAATPEIACRVLVAWFVDRQATLGPALERGDLGRARLAVSGSATSQIERFTLVYNKVLADL